MASKLVIEMEVSIKMVVEEEMFINKLAYR